MAGSYLDLCVVLKMLCVIEQATPVICSHDNILPFAAEVSCSDQLGPNAFNLIPECNLFVGNIPKAELAIQRATQEVPVILSVCQVRITVRCTG